MRWLDFAASPSWTAMPRSDTRMGQLTSSRRDANWEVRYALQGRVRKAGDRVRIGVILTDTETGREVWSERYERALVDVFAIQDEIAASVAVTIEPKLYAAERDRIQQKQPDRLDAWGTRSIRASVSAPVAAYSTR